MSFEAPKLDDRTFQQIVDEARRRIQAYCPEWTDHNDSDPGMTLIQLFAWMMDSLFYRMNLIPDLHYFKFLEFLGFERQVPKPAHAQVTFWLTKPQENFDPIPAGTEVATTQTETEEALIFTTEKPFTIEVPTLSLLVTHDYNRQQRALFDLTQSSERLRLETDGVNVFAAEPPRQDDVLYLGFTNDLSYHLLQLDLTVVQTRAAGGSREDPPYEWHVQNKDGWSPCEVVNRDTTENLNQDGRIQLLLPHMHLALLAGQTLFWLRLRLKEAKYTELSPSLRSIKISAIGCTIPVIHAQEGQKPEEVGVSNGIAGQRFRLHHRPILARRKGEHLCVQENGKWQTWQEVADFADSTENDPHYILDSQSGELRFGPAIRQPNGTFKQYGKIPPTDAILRFQTYRYLDAQRVGNVQRGKINTRKSSISYIKTVENRDDATSGREAETLEELQLRVARTLRTSQRAVTATDFEQLATADFNREQANQLVARAKCLSIKEKRQRLTSALLNRLFALLDRLQGKAGLSPALTELLKQEDRLRLEIAEVWKENGGFAPDLSQVAGGSFASDKEKAKKVVVLMNTLLDRLKEKADLARPMLIKLSEQKESLLLELDAVLKEDNSFTADLIELIRGSFAPDLVELLVVPYVVSDINPQNRLTVKKLHRSFQALRIKLEPFLNERCLLTTRLQLSSPTYQPVFVHISLNRPPQDREQLFALEQRVLSKLYTFISPVIGGREGTGWPFGRSLQVGDIYDCLQTGKDALKTSQIRQVRLFVGEENGAAKGRVLDEITIDPFTVMVSGLHIVKFELL